MRKLYMLMMAGLAACAVACQEKPLEPQTPETTPQEGHTMTFTAIAAQPEQNPTSRAVLDGKKTLWENGDGITVFSSNGQHAVFTTTLEAPAPEATFTCENAPANFTAPFTAVYGTMDQDKVKFEGGKIVGVEIPAGQVLKAGSYDRYAAPAIAFATEGTTLSFKNVATLLKFTVASDGVNKVTVWMNDESGNALPITGLGSLDYNNGNPLLTMDTTESAAKTYIDLTGNFVKGETYYMVVNPVSYHSLSAKVNGIPFKTSNHPKTLKRNTQVPLGEFTLPSTRFYLAGNEAAGLKWEPTLPFIEEDNYYVIKGFTFSSGAEFKVVDTKYNKWFKGAFAINEWSGLGEGEGNIVAGESHGPHDVYLKKDLSALYITQCGAEIIPTGETCHKIHVVGKQYNDLWAWSATNGNWFGAWPGKYRFDTVDVDGLGECNQWIVYLEDKFNENDCQLIFSYWDGNGRPQTETSASFSLTKDLYFEVIDNKPVQKVLN